jgi:hypothetical protein
VNPLATRKTIYSLSPALLQEVKALIEERRNRRPLGRPSLEEAGDLHQASDIFVALTPEGGIPATTGGDVGWAECEVYYLHDDDTTAELEATGQVLRVYNLAETEVAADTYVLVLKTKFGSWFVVSSVGGVELPDNCVLSKLKNTDCVRATVTPGDVSVIMTRNEDGRWESLTDLNYGYGVGPLEFWFEPLYGPIPHLTLDGLELLYCADSCWSGGELTGHLTNSGTGLPECAGASFQVCLECYTCTPPPVDSACCPSLMPALLNAMFSVPVETFSDPTGNCEGCFAPPVNVTLTWSDVTGDWRYTGPLCLAGGGDSEIRMYCDPGNFKLEGLSGCTFLPATQAGPSGLATCDPVDLDFVVDITNPTCCTPGAWPVYVKVTEA